MKLFPECGSELYLAEPRELACRFAPPSASWPEEISRQLIFPEQDVDGISPVFCALNGMPEKQAPSRRFTFSPAYKAQAVSVTYMAHAVGAGRRGNLVAPPHFLFPPHLSRNSPDEKGVVCVDGRFFLKNAPDRHVKGPVFWLVTQRNYSHWHSNGLPNLMLLDLLGWKDRVQIVAGEKTDYVLEALRAYGIDPEPVIFVKNEVLSFDQAIYPSFLDHRHDFGPQPIVCTVYESVARRVLKKQRVRVPYPKKIYISRQDSRNRVLENENELIGLLKKQGFFILAAQNHSYAEQIALMRDAEVIVGTHGAGMVNVVYCERKAAVLEIFPEGYMNPGTYRLCQLKGLPYGMVIGRHSPGFENSKKGEIRWRINIKELVQKMGEFMDLLKR